MEGETTTLPVRWASRSPGGRRSEEPVVLEEGESNELQKDFDLLEVLAPLMCTLEEVEEGPGVEKEEAKRRFRRRLESS